MGFVRMDGRPPRRGKETLEEGLETLEGDAPQSSSLFKEG